MKKTPLLVTLTLLATLAACSEGDDDGFFPDADNTAPVARLLVESRVVLGQPVLMDATTSGDNDGFITDFLFDPGDGTPLLQTTSAELFHTFETSGEFTVALTVIDDDGTKDTDRVEVLVTAP